MPIHRLTLQTPVYRLSARTPVYRLQSIARSAGTPSGIIALAATAQGIIAAALAIFNH